MFGGTPEAKFWQWFEKHEDMLFNFEKDQETVFDQLNRAMEKVHPDLTFEFSPVLTNGKREFVISAGGIKQAFTKVEALYAAAPELNRWEFIKFRPRRSPLHDLNYGDKSISANDVHFKMFKDGEKVGLVLFLDGYNDQEHEIYGNIGYLFLDEALGEYDVETKVGFIEFHSRESHLFEGSRSLPDLPAAFDNYFEQ